MYIQFVYISTYTLVCIHEYLMHMCNYYLCLVPAHTYILYMYILLYNSQDYTFFLAVKSLSNIGNFKHNDLAFECSEKMILVLVENISLA